MLRRQRTEPDIVVRYSFPLECGVGLPNGAHLPLYLHLRHIRLHVAIFPADAVRQPELNMESPVLVKPHGGQAAQLRAQFRRRLAGDQHCSGFLPSLSRYVLLCRYGQGIQPLSSQKFPRKRCEKWLHCGENAGEFYCIHIPRLHLARSDIVQREGKQYRIGFRVVGNTGIAVGFQGSTFVQPLPRQILRLQVCSAPILIRQNPHYPQLDALVRSRHPLYLLSVGFKAAEELDQRFP